MENFIYFTIITFLSGIITYFLFNNSKESKVCISFSETKYHIGDEIVYSTYDYTRDRIVKKITTIEGIIYTNDGIKYKCTDFEYVTTPEEYPNKKSFNIIEGYYNLNK